MKGGQREEIEGVVGREKKGGERVWAGIGAVLKGGHEEEAEREGGREREGREWGQGEELIW